MKKNNSKVWLAITGCILIILAVVLIIGFLLQGQTTISGEHQEIEQSPTLTCKANDYEYPFFTYDSSDKKTIEINLIFENNRIRTAALKYTLYYSDPNIVQQSEAVNHADMNISFTQNGLESEALGVSYSKQTDKLIMTLYANGSDLNSTEAKRYFLLPADAGVSSSSIDYYAKIYKDKDLKCEMTNN